MSGGHFDYIQFRFNEVIESIEELIENNDREYSNDTIDEFKKAVHYLKLAKTYLHRVDWLVSDDDGEESFHKHLKANLKELANEK